MRLVHESRLLNAVAPVELGGFDLGPAGDMVGFFDVLDALATGCSSTAQLVASDYAAMGTIKAVGNPEQLQRFSKVTSEDGATFCYLGSEPTQRFTTSGLRPTHSTIAKKVDGGWMVSGDKFFATGSVGCTYVMVLCWAEGYSDMSGIFVPILWADDPVSISGTTGTTWDSGPQPVGHVL
jgi:alkylation response protein AidB-like acyl-CoA dehydrogenase